MTLQVPDGAHAPPQPRSRPHSAPCACEACSPPLVYQVASLTLLSLAVSPVNTPLDTSKHTIVCNKHSHWKQKEQIGRGPRDRLEKDSVIAAAFGH